MDCCIVIKLNGDARDNYSAAVMIVDHREVVSSGAVIVRPSFRNLADDNYAKQLD